MFSISRTPTRSRLAALVVVSLALLALLGWVVRGEGDRPTGFEAARASQGPSMGLDPPTVQDREVERASVRGRPEWTAAPRASDALEVVVRDARGRPVTQAEVSFPVENYDFHQIDLRFGRGHPTDSLGRARSKDPVGVNPGGASAARVRAAGYMERVVDVPRGVTTRVVTLVAAHSAVVELVDEQGLAIAEPALLVARGYSADPAERLAAGRSRCRRVADGRYALTGLEPGLELISVEVAGFEPGFFVVATGVEPRTTRLTLRRSSPVEIQVVDPDRTPIEGALVELERVSRTQGLAGSMRHEARTDAEGRASLPRGGGPWTVSAPGYSTRSVSGREREGRSQMEVTLHLTTTLSIRLVDAAGQPVRATVEVLDREPHSSFLGSRKSPLVKGWTEADGGIEFDRLRPGVPLRVRVRAGHESSRVLLFDELVEALGSGERRERVLVLDAVQVLCRLEYRGQPCGGHVRFHRKSDEGRLLSSRLKVPSGGLVEGWLPSGEWTAVAAADWASESTRGASAELQVRLSPAENRFYFEFDGTEPLRGRLVDGLGAPLAGRLIRVASSGSDDEGLAATDEAGRFELLPRSSSLSIDAESALGPWVRVGACKGGGDLGDLVLDEREVELTFREHLTGDPADVMVQLRFDVGSNINASRVPKDAWLLADPDGVHRFRCPVGSWSLRLRRADRWGNEWWSEVLVSRSLDVAAGAGPQEVTLAAMDAVRIELPLAPRVDAPVARVELSQPGAVGTWTEHFELREPSQWWIRAVTVPEGRIEVRFHGAEGELWVADLNVPPGPYLRRDENPWDW